MKSNILMMDPLPIINKVFSFVVQQERQFNSTNALGNLSVINVVSKSNSCTYCDRLSYGGELLEKAWLSSQFLF